MVGADLDVGRLWVDGDGDGVAFEVGFESEVAEELDGENPRLELAVLGADEDTARAGYSEGLRRLCRAADDEACLGEREGGDLGLNGCCAEECGDGNEELP